MALRTNATLIFTAYELLDGGDVKLVFLCPDPGPEQESEYSIRLTQSELASVGTLIELRDLVLQALHDRFRATVVVNKLAGLIGQSLELP